MEYDFDSLYLCMYRTRHLREVFVGHATCTLEILAKQEADLFWWRKQGDGYFDIVAERKYRILIAKTFGYNAKKTPLCICLLCRQSQCQRNAH